MMTVNYDLLVEEVMRRTGVRDRKRAELTLGATLEGLGERLSAPDAAALAAALPPPLAAALLRLGRHDATGVNALFARVSVCAGLRFNPAKEQAQVVCRALGEALAPDERLLLQRRLPTDWATLFAEHRAVGTDGAVAPVSGHGHTLATGRPGSSHPISEARPDVTHSQSVAASNNPHADRKVSSAGTDRR